MLHGGSGVRRGGLARGFLFDDFGHARFFALQGGENGGLAGFIGQGELFQLGVLPLGAFGAEFGAPFVAVHVDRPVFLGFKGADFVFAFANQAQGGALHAPCG